MREMLQAKHLAQRLAIGDAQSMELLFPFIPCPSPHPSLKTGTALSMEVAEAQTI